MQPKKQGMNQERIQASNRALILELIRRNKVCSRASLAKEANLKQATLTNIVNDFISHGFVEEVGLITGNKGRRSIGISIARSPYSVLGFRLTRSGYAIGLFNLLGEEIASREMQFDKNSGLEQNITLILREIRLLVAEHPERKVLSMGLALPGPLDLEDGTILLMTENENWGAVNFKRLFEEALHLPVTVQHDACAGAWAQLWYNDKVRAEGVLLYMSIGQGVGSGILIDGSTFRGGLSVSSEVGHMSIDFHGIPCSCGNRGCLEKYTCLLALQKEVNQKLSSAYSQEEIKQLVRDNHPVAVEEYSKCCDYLGIGIVNLINCLMPTYIVLGDEMAKIAPNIMEERVNAVINQRVLHRSPKHIRVIMDAMDINSELYGAAVAAIRQIFNHYTQFVL